MEDSLEYYKWYLAAIIDGEGYVGVDKSTVSISNTDQFILDFCCKALDELGFKYLLRENKRPKSKPHWKHIWVIYICNRRDLRRIYYEFPIKSKAKLDRLKEISEKPKIRLHRDEWPMEKVKKLYDEGYSSRDIADILGLKSHKTVLHYMEKSGYSRRKKTGINQYTKIR